MRPRPLVAFLLVCGGLACGLGGAVEAKARNGVTFDTDAEAYLREQLFAGKDVDLNGRCGPFSPKSISDLSKAERCRTISGVAFAQLLQDKTIEKRLPPHGIVITGLYVRDDVELRWSDVAANFVCKSCLFGGKLALEGASFGHGLRFEGSELMAGLDARAVQVKGRLSLVDDTTIRGGRVDLSTATLSDMLETDNAKFDAESPLDISQAKVGLVRLASSKFAGGVRADDATIGGTFTIDGTTKIEGDGLAAKGVTVASYFKIGARSDIAGLDLTSARLKAGLEIAEDKEVAPETIGKGARIGSAITIPGTAHPDPAGLVLLDAGIDGALKIWDATIAGDVVADGATIAKGIDTNRARYSSRVSLNRATVGGDVEIVGGRLDGRLSSQKMLVAGSFYLERESARDVDLKGASVGADAEFVDATINGNLELDQASVGKSLALEGDTIVSGDTRLASVSMKDLTLGIDPTMTTKHVRLGEADLSLIKVSSSVFMGRVAFAKPLILVSADIKGHLDIATATLAKLDMTRASVGGDFRLAQRAEPYGAPDWRPDAELDLKNAHVGVIQDENESTGGKAWPTKFDLQGFDYDRFGSRPPIDWARGWLAVGSSGPEPFVRLAKYYTDEGHKEFGDQILYQAKQREKNAAWDACLTGNPASCAHAIGLTALWALIGYGIGNGLFQALIWVMVLTAIGALVIRTTHDASRQPVLWGGAGKGRLWCLGASVNHLIPLVELNPEFKSFFDDPKRERLRPWQLMYFAAHAVMGYVLASFVVAAIGGLTQSH